MLVLVFRKKNSGVDVDLVSEGNGVSLRQATVGRPHTLRSSVWVGIALFLYLLTELKITTMFKVFL